MSRVTIIVDTDDPAAVNVQQSQHPHDYTPQAEALDWPIHAAAFLQSLDPEEVERVALASADMSKSGTEAMIMALVGMLLPQQAEPIA